MQKEHYQDLGTTYGPQHSIPYTYLITHKLSGKKYYGVRYADSCHPNDLWNTYFTSSKVVKKLIEEDGKDNFEFQIRKVFSNIHEAISWEGRFLRKINARKRHDFFNLHNNDGLVSLKGDNNPMKDKQIVEKWKQSFKANKTKNNKKLSESHRLAISKSLTGRTRSEEEKAAISKGLRGKRHSEEYKLKCRERQIGVVPSKETRDKKSQAIKGRKKYTDGTNVKTFFPGSEPNNWFLIKKE